MQHPFAGLVAIDQPSTNDTPAVAADLNDLDLEKLAAGMDKQGQGGNGGGGGGQSTQALGEEGGGGSTKALREEGGGPTTLALREEGGKPGKS